MTIAEILELPIKICCHCKQSKPTPEFSKNSSRKDGLSHNCKTCEYSRLIKYRHTDKGREFHITAAKRYKQTAQGKRVTRISSKKYRDKSKIKTKARYVVSEAVRKGLLPKPDTAKCRLCPEQGQEYHHHRGYEKEHWLDVIPVCTSCHGKTCRKEKVA